MKLVAHLPPEPPVECKHLTTVFEGDPNSASVARATVEGAGIETWAKDEEVHGLFPNLGPTEILVCETDETLAIEALAIPERATVPRRRGQSAVEKSPSAGGAKSRPGSKRKAGSYTREGPNETSGKKHPVEAPRQGKPS